jgi:signal transduction histidine kinase
MDGERPVATSVSLGDARLELGNQGAEENGGLRALVGPNGEMLRGQVAFVSVPGDRAALTFVATAPEMQISDDVHAYFWHILQAFAVLGVGLAVAVLMQVRVALRPLRAIQGGIGDVRAGRATRLPQDFPSDVQPLADELNFLLDHNETLLKRARNQLADLAHAVKNPLTVIRNEARNLAGPEGKLILEQSYQMANSIDHSLSRARIFGRQDALGYRTSVRAVIEDLRYALEHIHKDRNIDIELACVEDRWFRGEAQDLEEMAGNLLDNACKWARGVVRVSCRKEGEQFVLVIEDDGPGIPEEEIDNVVRRGRKLDDGTPGHGHGLAIVRDIAELYGGQLGLGRSELGGLRVELALPSA